MTSKKLIAKLQTFPEKEIAITTIDGETFTLVDVFLGKYSDNVILEIRQIINERAFIDKDFT